MGNNATYHEVSNERVRLPSIVTTLDCCRYVGYDQIEKRYDYRLKKSLTMGSLSEYVF